MFSVHIFLQVTITVYVAAVIFEDCGELNDQRNFFIGFTYLLVEVKLNVFVYVYLNLQVGIVLDFIYKFFI